MTSKVFWSVLLSVVAVVPALVGLTGHWNWGLGLWLGAGVGLGAFFWIRWSVRQTLTPNAGNKNPFGLLGHSLARLATVGLIFFLVLKFPVLSIWAVLIGYTLIQLPTAVWQRVVATERK